jgi:hypothetical protein
MSKHPKPADGQPVRDRLGRKLVVVCALLAVVGIVPSLFIAQLDLGGSAAATPPADDTKTLDLTGTPADAAVTAAIAQHPASWTPVSTAVRSVLAPYPFSCTDAGGGPALSLSQDFTTSAGRVQLVVTAYTAGLGAEALDRLRAGAAKCASTGAATVRALAGAGAEAYTTSVTKGGSTGTVVSVRHGDVIAHASGPRSLDGKAVASDLVNILSSVVGPVCANRDSTANDGQRSPWSATKFVPLMELRTASIDDPGLPAIPVGALYLPTPIPETEFSLTAVTPNALPTYPVWPEMPAAVAFPVEPPAPASAPTLSATVPVKVEDATGPGCGWAFTGMTAPVFDAKAAAKAADSAVAAAELSLTNDADAWGTDVLAYWDAMSTFAPAATAYKAYADQVLVTNAAWNVIAADWSVYDADHASWVVSDTARTTFIAAQTKAQADYDKALSDCEATTGTHGPDCDTTVARPPMIDLPVPEAIAEPQPPRDPRPAR